MLIVWPTGYGKSLLFLLPALLLESKVCVVIVPFKALSIDLLRRCANVGIPAGDLRAARDDANNPTQNRLVVVMMDSISTNAYKVYIRKLYNMGRLHAIFIDEAHVPLT